MSADPYIGQEIAGQFRILEKIGTGGMGAVYKAEQPDMSRFVAIKILHSRYLSRTDLVARFRREARAMSHLLHPNTAKVYMYGQLEDKSCYFIMEHLAGRNLAQTVRAEGPLEPLRACHIMIQVCGALDEAHQAGIIHRDLKPENIFLTSQGGIVDFPKVLDFGLAKVTEREMRPGSLILTQEGMIFGTPEFMSPEQARGEKLDGRSDLYALGVILYELVTGLLPFDAKQPMEFIQKHVREAPIPIQVRNPSLNYPKGLWEVLAKCLAKSPNDRYQTAAEFAGALHEVVVHASGNSTLNEFGSNPENRKSPSGRFGLTPAHSQLNKGDRGEPAPSAPAPSNVLPWVILSLGVLLALVGVGALLWTMSLQ